MKRAGRNRSRLLRAIRNLAGPGGAVLISCVLLFLSGGCESRRQVDRLAGSVQQDFTAADLEDELTEFEEFVEERLVTVANSVAAREGTPTARAAALRMKTDTTTQLRDAIFEEDALVALVRTWSWSARLRTYLQEGEGRRLFGPSQEEAILAVREIEESIAAIADSYLNDENYVEVERFVLERAAAYPMTGLFDDSAARASLRQTNRLQMMQRIVTLPATPLTTVGRVGQTANTFSEFTRVAERFTDVAEDLPREMRWQAQLFAQELQTTPELQETIASLQRASAALEQAADTADTIPQTVRESVAGALAELEQAEPQLRELLERADSVSRQLNEALAQADTTTGSVAAAGRELAETARAWEETAAEMRAALKIVQELSAPDPNRDPDAEPIRLSDVRDVAVELRRAAEETRALLQDMQGFQEPAVLAAAQQRGERLVDASAVEARAVIDYAFSRALMLIVVLAMALIACLAALRLLRPRNRKDIA